jgi:hypothetical protein
MGLVSFQLSPFVVPLLLKLYRDSSLLIPKAVKKIQDFDRSKSTSYLKENAQSILRRIRESKQSAAKDLGENPHFEIENQLSKGLNI